MLMNFREAIESVVQSPSVERELQHENKLISYEKSFKMQENDIYIYIYIYIYISLESVKPFSSY